MSSKYVKIISDAIRYVVSGWRRTVLTVLLVLFSLAVIAQIINSNWNLLSDQEWAIAPIWFVYALLFFLIDLVISLLGWHVLVSKLADFRSFRLNTKFCLQSNLARRIPGSVWYIASRVALYQEVGISKRTTSMASALEMILFVMSGLLVTIVTIPFWFVRLGTVTNSDPIWWSFLLLLPLSIVLVHPRVLMKIWSRIGHEGTTLVVRWTDVVAWIAIYAGTWLVGSLVLFSIIRFFYDLSADSLIMIIGIWSLAGAISLVGNITLTGFGLREVSLILLLSLVLPLPVAIVVALVVRLLWLIGELLSSLMSFVL